VNDGEGLARRTFGGEDRLPRLPLPTLEESCETFLEWCAPLLTADELAETRRAVASFLPPDSPARRLHAALAEYSAEAPSWPAAFWSSRYLGRRDPTALNANFFLLLKDSPHGQVRRAAGLITAAVAYKVLLDTEDIPPVVRRGRALSMEQSKFLFSATRIPGHVQDTFRSPYSESQPGPSPERHILVCHRGRMFRMDVIDAHGRPYGLDDLMAGLRALMAAAMASGGMSVGPLTTMPRDEWAKSRQALLDHHPRNAETLDAVERALFCVCLEETVASTTRDACDRLLHGDSRDRWFDKALSLIVFPDGRAGINVEHSHLDGSTIADFVDALHDLSVDPVRSRGVPAFKPIDFILDAGLRDDVRAAAASFAACTADTVTSTLTIEGFGADRAKESRISPDAFAQMAYQLAHKRARRFVGATYESISTRHYRHGRTEAMRVVTPEVAEFVAAMDDAGVGDATRRAAFRAAAAKHAERVQECQAGRAPEQHLWELDFIRRRRGKGQPLALYESPGWRRMRDDYLSTSSTMSVNVRYFGFGPTGDQCIGIAYMVLPDRLSLYLSARRPMRAVMDRFTDELKKAVGELRDLLSESSSEPGSPGARNADVSVRHPRWSGAGWGTRTRT
jgi:carnitine O-acetyltransferase